MICDHFFMMILRGHQSVPAQQDPRSNNLLRVSGFQFFVEDNDSFLAARTLVMDTPARHALAIVLADEHNCTPNPTTSTPK